MENYPAPNVKSAKVKKACSMEAGEYFLFHRKTREYEWEKSTEAVADYEG